MNNKILLLGLMLVTIIAVSGCTQQIITLTDPAPQITHIYDLSKYRLDLHCENTEMEFHIYDRSPLEVQHLLSNNDKE